MKILRVAMSSLLKIQMFFVLLELVTSEENIDAPETWIMRSKFNFITVIILKASFTCNTVRAYLKNMR